MKEATRRRIAPFLSGAAVALLMVALTLNRLGETDVCGGSEAAMAVYVQQMIEHQELLFPLDNCRIPMYKPPLYHWSAAALASLLHQRRATPFNLRLPSALYATAGTILTMVFAGWLLGPRAGVLAGLLLCGSYQYVSQARIGLVDMTLTFCETLALYAFFGWLIARQHPARPRVSSMLHYTFALALGLGVLAKGPVGLILPGGAAVGLLLLQRDWCALRQLIRPGPIIAGGAVASSWYLACLITGHYDFLKLQMGSENFGRFFGSLGSMPPWYYVQPLLLNSLPLSLFVPPAAVCAALPILRRQSPRDGAVATSATIPPPDARIRLGAGLMAIFWLLSVLFFALASYKRRNYLLPLWPPGAVLLAWWTVAYLPRRLGDRYAAVVYRTAVGTGLALAIANLVFLPAYELHGCGAPFTARALFAWPAPNGMADPASASIQTRSYRAAAAAINRTTGAAPLYVIGIDDALEPLVFYLGRCVKPLASWRAAPADGFVISTVSAWHRADARNAALSPVVQIPYDHTTLVLLRPLAKTVSASPR